MADLLTHVLVAFIVFTVAGWRVGWLDRKWVVVAMVGALFPDLNKIGMVLNPRTVEATLGIPFSWAAIPTLGGVVVLSGIGAVIFATGRHRHIAFPVLLCGALTHLLGDALVAWADGHDGASLYPLTYYRLPTPGLYVSSDPRVLVTALVCALLVFAVDRHLESTA